LQHYIIIPKPTGTISDLLLAFGAAGVLRHVVQQHKPGAQVVLIDNGPCFIVDAGVAIQSEWVETTRPFEPIVFLSSAKMPPPTDLPTLGFRNVDDEW
jgi:hypothetical protein